MGDLSAYNDYEREFLTLTQSLPTRISNVTTYETDKDAAVAELRRIESDVVQAKQMLGSMEMEVRGLSEPTRGELGSKIRTYRDTLASLNADISAAKGNAQRSALLTGGRDEGLDLAASLSHRERMASANQRLSNSTSLLEQSRRTLAETEETAMDITTELDRNRATLHSARRKIGEVGGMTDQARRILRSMSRREVRIKIYLTCFILLMLGLISVVVYFLWIKKKK